MNQEAQRHAYAGVEEARRQLFWEAAEQAWESICITDADLEEPGPRFVYANRGYEELMGYRESEILGKNPRIHQGPLTDRAVLDRLKKNLKAGENFHGETINYRKNGEAFWLEWKISPVKDAAGKITHFIAFQRDVTEAKAAQQRIKDFHSVLAHELRAPLTSILGSLSLIQMLHAPADDEGKEFLNIASSSTERLIALINDLLDLSKFESGAIELKLADVSVRELVELAAKSLVNYRVEDQVKIEFEAVDTSVCADKERVVQVLVNLISNAMKYSPQGGTVKVFATATEGGTVSFFVNDNGPGISQENQLKLFTKFQQLVSEDGIHRQGTGLGLSTAKALIEQHGGRIGVQSEVGKGSTFWFELKQADVTTDSNTDVTTDSTADAASEARVLLLLEDDVPLTKVLRTYLSKEGYTIQTATSIAAAEEILQKIMPKPTLCIVDMILPDGTGLKFAERLQNDPVYREMPILMTSASRFSQADLAGSAPAKWLNKPYKLTDLTQRIEQILIENSLVPGVDSD